MHGSDMSGACCQTRSQQTTVVADAPVLPKHCHAPELFYTPDPVLAVITTRARRHARAASPPQISPGTNSILRI